MDTTSVIQQQLTVPFAYEVAFTRAIFDPQNPLLARSLSRREPGRRHRALVIVDSGVAAAHPRLDQQIERYFTVHANLSLVAPPVLLPGGEAVKNDPGIVDRVHRVLHAHHIDRQSFAIIVGGGAVLDAAGYAAATAHRGVRTVRLPTTVLSQNDSGVGVKNGINAFGAKNFLGTFFPPFAVINDFDFLKTLPRRDTVAGYAEAVKVALIRDAAFFGWLEDNADALADCVPDAVAHLVRRCAELHMAHIATSGDPFELGSAKPLDYGHWAAHRLESLTSHELRHGEAVALGIQLDSRYAALAGLLPAAACERIETLVARLGLPTWHPALLAQDGTGVHQVLQGLDDFREHLGGELSVTLLRDIGRAIEAHEMDRGHILEAIAHMQRRAALPEQARRGALGS